MPWRHAGHGPDARTWAPVLPGQPALKGGALCGARAVSAAPGSPLSTVRREGWAGRRWAGEPGAHPRHSPSSH